MDWKDAYINNALQFKGIKDDELQAASEYVTANLNEDDSNFSEVLNDLSFHFDLDNRQQTEQSEEASVGEGGEDTDYKALAKQYEEQLSEMKNREVEQIKRQAMTSAGFSERQYEMYRKYIEGDNPEAIQAAVSQLKYDIKPASEQGDPNIFNPPKAKVPKTTKKDLQAYGGKMYDRIKHKRHY